jgi:hypothetical protein
MRAERSGVLGGHVENGRRVMGVGASGGYAYRWEERGRFGSVRVGKSGGGDLVCAGRGRWENQRWKGERSELGAVVRSYTERTCMEAEDWSKGRGMGAYWWEEGDEGLWWWVEE